MFSRTPVIWAEAMYKPHVDYDSRLPKKSEGSHLEEIKCVPDKLITKLDRSPDMESDSYSNPMIDRDDCVDFCPSCKYHVDWKQALYVPDILGTFIFAGMTESGKTEAIRNFAFLNAKSWHEIFVLCPTALRNGSYNFVDDFDQHVISNPERKHIEGVLGFQRVNPNTKTCLILDDCLGTLSLSDRDPLWDKIASSCRQYNMTVIISTQHLAKIAPIIRDNSKRIYASHLKEGNLKILHDCSSGLGTFGKFKDFFGRHGRKHQFVCFNTSASAERTTTVFKSPKSPNFLIERPKKKT